MKTLITQAESLLSVLERLSPDSSKNTLRSWVEKGRVSIDGRLAKRINVTLQKGQEVTVGKNNIYADEGLKIVYEDRDIVVIEKPAKLLSVGLDEGDKISAHAILKNRKRGMVYPVHRLDRDTSGLLVFAYTQKAREVLQEQFAAHTTERLYLGLVSGVLATLSGTWKSELIEDDHLYVKSAESGKTAITHYETLVSDDTTSVMSFQLETGRKNQIRVHAKEAGHPLIGDKKYGEGFVKGRLCLHAFTLGFRHPTSGKMMRFTTALPDFTSKYGKRLNIDEINRRSQKRAEERSDNGDPSVTPLSRSLPFHRQKHKRDARSEVSRRVNSIPSWATQRKPDAEDQNTDHVGTDARGHVVMGIDNPQNTEQKHRRPNHLARQIPKRSFDRRRRRKA